MKRLFVKQAYSDIGVLLLFFISTLTVVLLIASVSLMFFYGINNGFGFVTPFGITFFIAIALIITFMAIFYQNYGAAHFCNTLCSNIRDNLLRSLISQDIAFFEKNKLTDIPAHIVFDIASFQNLLEKNMLLFLRHTLTIFVSGILIVWISSLLFFISILLLPGIFIQHFYLSKQTKIGLEHQNMYLKDFSNTLYEVFDKIKIIRMFNQSDKIMLDCQEKIESINVHHRTNAFRVAFSLAAYVLFFLAILAGIVFVGADLIAKEHVSIGSLTAFLYLFFLIFISLYALGQNCANFNEMWMLARRIDEYLCIKPLEDKAHKKLKEYPAKGFIAFHNVRFAYPQEPSRIVIDNVNLSIYPHQTIAIVGPPGAGKTTLLNLLVRFYKPQAGHIYLDGTSIHALSLHDICTQIAMVDQDTMLFSTTITNNVKFGNPHISDEEVSKLLDILMPNSWHKLLPQGIYTKLGPQGRGLSVGQKQCICLARALVRNPSVLLLDEALSGLDSESQAHVNKSLVPILKDRTTIMVTHKLSNITFADQVVLMDSGRVIAQGSHDALLNENLSYRRLVKADKFSL